eukprot:TRINITY_DN2828_c0_g1_i1.p1 TRINITY_DN2828_c0_g1~~TRINITY_DN2828_c0_g1_i1.p1  ORF type:complete len:403 (+),score=33.44 TRINITY_DN2828_c0_g1_i1:101-1309(+)
MIPTVGTNSTSSVPVLCGVATIVPGKCICPSGFGGNSCQDVSILESTFFIVHILIFCVLFVVTAVWGLLNVAAATRLRTLASKGTFTEIPTILLFLIIAIGSLSRIFFLSIDPYGFKSIIPQFGETVLEGVLIWSLYGSGVLVIVVWNDTYTSWNTEMKSKLVRPIALLSLCTLLVACVCIQWLQRTFSQAFHVVIASFATAVSILFGIGFIIRSTQLVRALRLEKVNTRRAILMRKIQKITKSTMAILIIVVLCRTIGTVLEWWVGSSYNFLFFHSLHRLMEVVAYACILFHFRTHDHYEYAFCGEARSVHFRLPDSGTRSQGSRLEDEFDEEQMLYDDEDEENIYNDDGDILSAEELSSANTSPRSAEWVSDFRSSESMEADEASDGSSHSQPLSRESLP